ncbi:Heme response regulator hssR [uncultured Eubacterium sp.]|nr:Heme response regulator hssR [uncultured Eubacterium sp.]
MFNILVVEDDRDLRELFCTVLVDHGYTAIPAADGEEALDILDSSYVDLIISDIMMPKMDGYALTKTLREANFMMPVLMITARESPADKREGFRAGTDDYMVKPIDVNEMIWRVEALLRRSQIVSERKAKIGQTLFDCDTLTVTANGTELELPQKEFFLLYKLVASPGRIFTRRQIMDEIWGMDSDTDTHTLDVHISRLRERFKENPDFDIVTVRGLGYKVVKK